MIKKILKGLGIILVTTMISTSLTVNANGFEAHKQMIDRLPKNVKEIVSDYTFVLGDKAEETLEKYGHTKQTAYGLHIGYDKTIVVNNYRYNNREDDVNDYWFDIHYELTLLHEIGHAVDYIRDIGYRSNGQEFFNIYLQERDKLNFGLNQEYHKSSSIEFFANAFANYFYSDYTNQQLKDNLPLTYEYVHTYIDK